MTSFTELPSWLPAYHDEHPPDHPDRPPDTAHASARGVRRGARLAGAPADLRRPRRHDARSQRCRPRSSAGRHPAAHLRCRGSRRQPALPLQASPRPPHSRQPGRPPGRRRDVRELRGLPQHSRPPRPPPPLDRGRGHLRRPRRRRRARSDSAASVPARCSTSSTTSTASSSPTASPIPTTLCTWEMFRAYRQDAWVESIRPLLALLSRRA